MSESHNRQMLLISSNPQKYEDQYSRYCLFFIIFGSLLLNSPRQFKDSFLDLMRVSYFSKPVSANKIYQDYISDRKHVHMNSTKWTTLTEFCKDLEKNGYITIEDQDERNSVIIQYVDRGVESALAKQQATKNRKIEHDEKYMSQKNLMSNIEYANSIQKNSKQDRPKVLDPLEKDENSHISSDF